MKVGVVGLGGLGHMAVKFLKAFGCEVTVISTSSSKREEALKHLGADRFVISKSEDEVGDMFSSQLRRAWVDASGSRGAVTTPHEV